MKGVIVLEVEFESQHETLTLVASEVIKLKDRRLTMAHICIDAPAERVMAAVKLNSEEE